MSKTYLDRTIAHHSQKLFASSDIESQLSLGRALQAIGAGKDNESPKSTYNRIRKSGYGARIKTVSEIICDMFYDRIYDEGSSEQDRAEYLAYFLHSFFAYKITNPDKGFFENDSDVGVPTTSLHPTRELVERMFNAGNIDTQSNPDIAEYIESQIWHIDFPNHALDLSNGRDIKIPAFVKSVVYAPTIGLNIITLILPQEGMREIHLGCVEEGEHETVLCTHPEYMEGLQDLAESIIWSFCRTLAVYYWTQQDASDTGIIQRVEGGINRPSVKAAKRAPKGISLFTHTQLGINDSDGSLPTTKQAEDNRRGYSHGFEVQGHFRWQACGPKHSQRKLIYIASFVKGDKENVVPKAELHTVR
ncbi:hypothetical protein [Neptuniibacter sp. QD37_11]|uniref:hypothetical protein n=1 Tax=Neptuniibacter sp. QD37_11 TaxID=3398209 RepID=UPI0039F58639